MAEDRFEAIIVGGGLAGLAAGLALAEAGVEVVLVERGPVSGSKNLTGGRLYGHSLERLVPGFADEAPIERRITKERLSLLTEQSATTVEFASTKLAEHPSYSVLRAPFDQWLADKAEAAGALILNDVRVDSLQLNGTRVTGIVAGDEVMEADVVLLADGALSLLARKAGLIPEPDPHHYAVGAKEVIALDEQTISDRFGVAPGDGCAWMFDGFCTDGHVGGGFIYTNKDSISLGIVTTIGDIDYSDTRVPDMVERLKVHPVVAPLIADGTMVEYGGHMTLEGGYPALPELVHDGALLLGDAAGFGLNTGLTIRGMDFAIESGRLAALAVLDARQRGDFSRTGLASYRTLLEASFVLKDLHFYRRFPAFLEQTRNLFTTYPGVAEELMLGLFTVSGAEPVPIRKRALAAVQQVGLSTLARDAARGLSAMDGGSSIKEHAGRVGGALTGARRKVARLWNR